MEIQFTARKFKAHKEIRDHALAAVKRLDKYYDGIVRADIVLSYERGVASVKTVEINLHVHGNTLTAKEPSDDFYKSIDLAINKLERQLAKHKTKERTRDKKTLRRVKESIAPPIEEEE
ncbi:MAG: ribosome-associated translation inhibitor RaiA [Ignavibacteriae bacterium]|nr:ribosome-associated translation inhibitor RaiA [Ignavibacteria bacterium]MBI3364855.1 ribosome-associated translation inhibitor RaiA [Ignavibacteriota bacterium]